MNEDGISRRRNLPHIDVADKPFFITACLKGSISTVGLKQIRQRRQELENRPKPAELNSQDWQVQIHKQVFKFMDSLLDGHSPICHLKDNRLAEIVQNAFLHFADDRYRLFAYVVMPSHHHWVFQPTNAYCKRLATEQQGKANRRTSREAISHSIQSFTATQCNRVLGRNGPFWQTETFDHYARNDDELLRIIQYIEQNPVVAGQVQDASEFRWSSAYLRKKLSIPMGHPIPASAMS